MDYLGLVQSAVVGTYSAGLAAAAVAGKLLYWATVPFRYPAYYLWALLSFLLSPLWFLVDLARSATLLAISTAVRFRYVYIYFACATMIGLLAAFVLHGTSSLLFVLLRLHPSQQPPAPPPQARPLLDPSSSAAAAAPALHPAGAARPQEQSPRRLREEDEDEDDFDFEGSALETTASSSRTSVSTSDAPVILRNRKGRESTLGDLYENHWRVLSDHRKAPVKSRHRGKLKGLLAQTIHEESSESESL